jgi:hypothetical protein
MNDVRKQQAIIKDELEVLLYEADEYRHILKHHNVVINVDINNIKLAYHLRSKIRKIPQEGRESYTIRYLLNRIYNLTSYYHSLSHALYKYKMIKNIPYIVFKHIVERNNKLQCNNVLNGGSWNLQGGVGHIQIFRMERKFVTKNDVPVMSISWGKSYKQILNIAECQEVEGKHNLYTAYTTKQISRDEFMHSIKQYLYSEANPTYPKYLVYKTDDEYLWWAWYGRSRFNKNVCQFAFEPTSFMNGKYRTIEEYAANATSIEDVLAANKIGNMDKVTVCQMMDNNFKLRYTHE